MGNLPLRLHKYENFLASFVTFLILFFAVDFIAVNYCKFLLRATPRLVAKPVYIWRVEVGPV
jgi:hypothetical protein